MNALAIQPVLSEVTVSALEAATTARDSLLSALQEIQTVADRLDADSAAIAVTQAKRFIKEIEEAKAAAKAPVLELGRKIDALSKELTLQVEAEAARLGRLVGTYEAEQRRKADEARRAAEDEARAIRRKADEEALAAMRTALTREEALRAQDEIKGQAAAAQVEVLSQVKPAQKLAGVKLRKEVKFEVLDLRALYADSPELVKLEPNTAAIKAIVKNNPNIQLPGLRHWIEETI